MELFSVGTRRTHLAGSLTSNITWFLPSFQRGAKVAHGGSPNLLCDSACDIVKGR